MSSNNIKTKGLNYLSAKDITADDYGKYVTNYATPCGIEKDTKHGIGGWRIFYADDKNIYLIADDYIHKTYAPKGKKGSKIYENADYRISMDDVINDYDGTSDITDITLKNLNKKYFDKGYTSTFNNMKAVAYMLDTNIWNKKFKNENYADYAIGGPSLELFVSSYNKKYENTGNKIVIDAINNTGYKIKYSSDSNYGYWIGGLDTSDGSMYVKSAENAYAMWLCSPSAHYEVFMFGVRYDGSLNFGTFNSAHLGFRPVVCLKSDIQLQKTEDVFEIQD